MAAIIESKGGAFGSPLEALPMARGEVTPFIIDRIRFCKSIARQVGERAVSSIDGVSPAIRLHDAEAVVKSAASNLASIFIHTELGEVLAVEDRRYVVVEDRHASGNRLVMEDGEKTVSFMEPRGFADEETLIFAKFEHCAQFIEDVVSAA